ncbi:MAG TPA: nucleotidyltransferase family protein [Polyangia bacterium]|nr:nucleotidyltransferase family protein [Polyangia bacterium]
MALSSFQHVVLFHHFRLLLERAAKVGIDVAPLKGAHLVTAVYPPGEDRGMMADVDFLVRPGDWDVALELLRGLGFTRREGVDRLATSAEFHEAGFVLQVDPARSILFEPHRQFAQPARHSIDYEAVWDRSRPGEFDGAPCRRLAPEDHLLHGVVHLLSHRFRDPARGLRDLELLVRLAGTDLDLVVDRAREWECATAAWLALTLLHGIAPDLSADRAASRIAPRFWKRAVLRMLVPDAGGFRLEERGLRTDQAVLWPWLLDSAGQGIRFARYYAGLRIRDLR